MPSVETDDRIIALLQQNADLTYKEMAKRLKLNESTVRKRVIALRKRGVIRRFLAQVDAQKLGFKIDAGLGITVDPAKMMDAGKKLSQVPETRLVFSTSGEYDFFAVVWTKDRESLEKIINNISSFDGVTKVIPSILVERLK